MTMHWVQTRWRLFALMAFIGLQITAASAVSIGSSGKKVPKVHAAIWQPSVGDSWQIVLQSPINISTSKITPNVKVWNLDLYDNSGSTFRTLQQAGKYVICYFSAGSWEQWREDSNQFQTADLGNVLDGWADERWINISSPNVRKIMQKRIAYASRKGCNALDPDNIDGYQTNNGLNLTVADSIDYIKFLSNTAAEYGLGIGLKNCPSIIPDILSYVRFAIVEQCTQYAECLEFQPFIKAGKPVFEIEYPHGVGKRIPPYLVKQICPGTGTNYAGNQGFSTIIKKINLDGWAQYCGSSTTFSTPKMSYWVF